MPHIKLDANVMERQMIVENRFQISAVRVVEQFRAIGEKHQGRRMYADLSRIKNFRAAILPQRRRLLFQGPSDHAIQFASAHTGVGLFVQVLS